jgi:hypothetical protein
VHVDASVIALGVILVHPGTGKLDHPIVFSSRKLSESAELQYYKKGRLKNGICTTEVQTLPTWETL